MIRCQGVGRASSASMWRVGAAAVLALMCLAWNGAPARASTAVLRAHLASVGAVRGDGAAAELVAQVQCSALAEVDIQVTLLQAVSGQLAQGDGDLRVRCARGSHDFKVPVVGGLRFKTGAGAATLTLRCEDQPCQVLSSEKILSLGAGVNFDQPVATSPYNPSLAAALGSSANLQGDGTTVLATARLTCRQDTSSFLAQLSQTNADGSVHTEWVYANPQCAGAPHPTTVTFYAPASPFHPGKAFLQLDGSDSTRIDPGGQFSSVVTWRQVAVT